MDQSKAAFLRLCGFDGRPHWRPRGRPHDLSIKNPTVVHPVLALLLDVKGAFVRVNKKQLLRRMIQVGIAGKIVRWVDSFLSD
jgi:hypothetical protein